MKTITDVLTKASSVFMELEDLEGSDEGEGNDDEDQDEAELKGMLDKSGKQEDEDEEDGNQFNGLEQTDLLKQQLKEQKSKEKDDKNSESLLIDPEFEKGELLLPFFYFFQKN